MEIYVKCSKGTYLRALAHDIGEKSGYGAYLKNLRRVAINNFNIDKALSLQDFNNYWCSLN
jgi:tRNA pseudouridine55 synthase